MITIFGFNTSVDKTMEARGLRLGAVNRVGDVRSYPGGKGLHVALTVAALGEPVSLVGLIDAAHHAEFQDFLGERGVLFHGVETARPLRTCLAIRDQDGARTTEILEPGPPIDPAVRDEGARVFLRLARDSACAVISGSLPPGFSPDTYAHLVTALDEAGVRCLLDASGELLRRAVAAQPFLVKPNRDEGEDLTGALIDSPRAAVRAARSVFRSGVAVVIQSLGAQGAVAVSADEAVHAWVPPFAAQNTVGSGDCLLGGVATSVARSASLDETLRLGVACGAANAASRETGFVQKSDVLAWLPRVSMARL